MAGDLLPVGELGAQRLGVEQPAQDVGRLARRRGGRRALEQEDREGIGRVVGLQQIPQPVDHDRRVGLLLLQHAVDRLAHRRELGGGEIALAIDRREARGEQHGVALAQRDVERGGELHHHLAAGPGAARLEEADMALRHARLQRQGELAGAAAPAPGAQHGAEQVGLGGRAAKPAGRCSSWAEDSIGPPARRLPPP